MKRPYLILAAGLKLLMVGTSVARAANELCGTTVTQNLLVTADQTCNGDGLIVGADGITLDLGGFTLSGDGGSDDFGILTNGHSVTIKNGTVRGFFEGIANGAGPKPAAVKVSGLTVRENRQFGAQIFAGTVVIEKSSFVGNGGANGGGLTMGCDVGKISASTFVGNVGDGFSSLGSSNLTITKVVSAANTGRGASMFNGQGVVVQSSTFARNGLEGVSVSGFGSTTTIAKSTIVGNGDNGVTIFRMSDSSVTKNVISGNAGVGVSVLDFSQRVAVVGNRVLGNRNRGIVVQAGPSDTLVKGNVAAGNEDGIAVASATTVVAQNAVVANLGTGILAAVTGIDGGGNSARANGAATQCAPAVACAPPFTPKPGPVTPTCGMHVTTSITLGADTPPCSIDGLIIDADGVTIDLNGHTVVGDVVTSGTTGILVGDHDKVTIKNGVVSGFGIGIASSFGQGLKIQNVEARSNDLFGAALGGSDILVTKSVFVSNSETGLFFFDATAAPKVSQGFFVANGHDGLVSRAPGTALAKVTATTNGSSGIVLENAGSGAVSGSLVAANAENGIALRGAAAPVKLTKNVVVGNWVDGIGSVTNGAGLTIASNLAGGNGQHGVHVGPSATNAVTKNALLGNGSDGLLVETTAVSSQVTANVATGNGNRGIAVSTSASAVAKNTARANLAIGITAAPGTIDGGGNAARDNAGVAQCTNIACN